MNTPELTSSQHREPLKYSPEQEAREAIMRLTQRIIDMDIRESASTPDFTIDHKPASSRTDPRTHKDEKTATPQAKTQIYDNHDRTFLTYIDTPIDIYFIIASTILPPSYDTVIAHYRR